DVCSSDLANRRSQRLLNGNFSWVFARLLPFLARFPLHLARLLPVLDRFRLVLARLLPFLARLFPFLARFPLYPARFCRSSLDFGRSSIDFYHYRSPLFIISMILKANSSAFSFSMILESSSK